MRKSALMALACLNLTACYSFRGPETVWGPKGLESTASYGPRGGPMFQRFQIAAAAASGCNNVAAVYDPKLATDAECSSEKEPSHVDQKRFMRAAYTVIYADCDHYFAHMGRRQSGSRILRASVGPLTTLLTGLITLRDFTNGENEKDLLTALTLGSGAARSGLDVFDDNFLFGANQIDAVQQLINRALNEHAAETLKKEDLTFDQAVVSILENQALCRPSQIMRLTRDAIANGKIEARPDDKPKDEAKTENKTEKKAPDVQSTSVAVAPPK